MGKLTQRILASALSFVLVVGLMPSWAFAAELVEPQDASSNDAVTSVADEPTAEAIDASDDASAEEANEGTAEAPVLRDAKVALQDGTYNATGLTSSISMYGFVNPQVVVKGDEAWLITTVEKASNETTLNRYDGMAYGKHTDVVDRSDETHKTLVEGTPVARVIPVYDDEGELTSRTFVLPVPKSVLEANENIYYVLKYVANYGSGHDGDWYITRNGFDGNPYYFYGYTLNYVSDSTILPGDDTPAPQPEVVELEIDNKTGMFKAVSASAAVAADGSAVLTVALSGTSYHWLYKGTYEEALAAKDQIAADIAADKPGDKLFKYATNDEGKYEFQIPVASDELGNVIPIVSISDTYYQKFLKGQNPLERAFYPRQFVVDLDAETLVVNDYDNTVDFVLTSEVADFKAASPVSVHIVGGPNSNNYSVAPTFVMQDATYDSVTYPTVLSETAEEPSTTTAVLTDGKFAITMSNIPKVAAFQDKTPLTFTFHVAANAPYEEAGTDVVRTVTFDQVARTIKVEGTALTPKQVGPSYAAGQYIVGVQSIKMVGGAAYGMFVPNYDGVEGKALVTVDAEGNATINYYNTRNTYGAIYLGEPENLGKAITEEQMADTTRYKVATVHADNSSWREFAYEFDLADLGQTVPYVTLNKSNVFNSSQLAFVFDSTMTTKAAYDVISAIDALPKADDVTIRDKDAIESARAAYEALSAAQKAEVTNLDKLVAAEQAYAALPEKDEQTIAVENLINALITQYTEVNDATAAAVVEARTAYDALTPQQKAYIDDATYHKLARAEACVQFATANGVAEGWIVDVGIDTSAESPFIAATISPRSNAAYVYLYFAVDEYNNAAKVSGAVSRSSHNLVGDKTIMKGLWQVQTDEGQGREFVIKLTGPNGDSEDITVKVPASYGTMDEGTYEVQAIQDPESKMRKFESAVVTSDGNAMTVTFTMPNTTYGEIFLGTKEAAAADNHANAITPTGTAPTSGTTGVGNVYTIPLESLYQPMFISYCNLSEDTWTQETVTFVLDDEAQAVIDAIAALELNTYFNVTADQREKVQTAKALYDALDDNQKAIVNAANGPTLRKVVAMFEIADIVAAEIEALPKAEDVTAADAKAIYGAKADFDGMGSSDIIKNALGPKPDGTPNTLQNSQIEKLVAQELRDKLNADLNVLKGLSVDLDIVNNVGKMFSVDADKPALEKDGVITIPMTSTTSYTDAFVGEYAAASAATETVPLSADKSFVFPSTSFANGKRVAVSFKSSKGWYERFMTVDRTTGTVTFDKSEADYAAVDAAKAKVPQDLSIYTDETKKAVDDAVAAVVEGKFSSQQAEVDAMAKAIEDAIAALVEKPADYSAVDAAKAKAAALERGIYTDESLKAVDDAVAAVAEGKTITQQAEVDAMAKAIEDAIAALVEKPLSQYTTHVQNVGWQEYKIDGEMSGTEGQSLRLEGIKIKLDGRAAVLGGSIEYRTHVQNIGWQNYMKDGEMAGTEGQGLRLEAIQIKLEEGSEVAAAYDVYYRVHAQNIGWMGWAKNGEEAGTAGYAYRLEAIQIVLVEKGGAAPGDVEGIASVVDYAFESESDGPSDPYRDELVSYNTHVQNVGWQEYVSDGAMAGTSGKSYRLEGIHIRLGGPAAELGGSIEYSTHVQNIGWQKYMKDGEMAGTSGMSYRLEAIKIRLEEGSEVAAAYDVYYRVHAQNIGWMGWAKNGEQAGTAGYAYRLEAIQIVLVEKGGEAPGKEYKGITSDADYAFVEK